MVLRLKWVESFFQHNYRLSKDNIFFLDRPGHEILKCLESHFGTAVS